MGELPNHTVSNLRYRAVISTETLKPSNKNTWGTGRLLGVCIYKITNLYSYSFWDMLYYNPECLLHHF